MIYLIAIFCLLPDLAWAGNINVPTIILTERLMVLSFVFIVALEAAVFYKRLPDFSKKRAFFISLKSNLITIFLVVPLVWGLWLAIIMNMPEFIVSFMDNIFGESIYSSFFNVEFISNITCAPLIIDTQSLLLAEWIMAPVYFIASYYIEYWFSRKSLSEFNQSEVKKAFFYANLYSYLMIMAFETIYQIIITPYKALNPNLF